MFDYIVVGAGSAGCVLAHRLSEDPSTRVLLLEAGPPDQKKEIHIPVAFSNVFKTEYDWNYRTAPQEHLNGRELYWPRGRTLGGSSSINAQMHVRGNPADYDRWSDLGNDGWDYRSVLPYFKKLERDERWPSPYRGAHGPLTVAPLRDPNPMTTAFVEGGVEAGIPYNDDYNGPVQDGVGPTVATQKDGKRCSTAVGYLHPVMGRENLTVRTGAHVTRVVFEGKRAVGVECLIGARRFRVEAGREVILSGGAINSPQLLMLSGVGPADHLRAHGIELLVDLPGVGQSLQDHPALPIVFACTKPLSLISAESPLNLARFLLQRKGMLTSNVAEAMAFVRTRPGLGAPDLQLIFAPVPFVNHGLEKAKHHGFTFGAILLDPKSAGWLRLRSSDPLTPPLIEPNYLSDEGGEDMQVLVEGVKLARRICATAPFDPFRGREMWPGEQARTDDDLRAFVRVRVETLYHPVGTCRMGADDTAVVDAALRVRGAQGLRVVDASIMPKIVLGNTNTPTIMVAEKAADLIRDIPPPPPHTG